MFPSPTTTLADCFDLLTEVTKKPTNAKYRPGAVDRSRELSAIKSAFQRSFIQAWSLKFPGALPEPEAQTVVEVWPMLLDLPALPEERGRGPVIRRSRTRLAMELLSGTQATTRRGTRDGVPPLPVPPASAIPAAWQPVLGVLGGHPGATAAPGAEDREKSRKILAARSIAQLAVLAPKVDARYADPAALPTDAHGVKDLYVGLTRVILEAVQLGPEAPRKTRERARSKAYRMLRSYREAVALLAAAGHGLAVPADAKAVSYATTGLKSLPDLAQRLVAAGETGDALALGQQAMVRALAPDLAGYLDEYIMAIEGGTVTHRVAKKDVHYAQLWDEAQRWVARLIRAEQPLEGFTYDTLFRAQVPAPKGLKLPGRSTVPLAMALLFREAGNQPARSRYTATRQGLFLPKAWVDETWNAWHVVARMTLGDGQIHRYAVMVLRSDRASASDRELLQGHVDVMGWLKQNVGARNGVQVSRNQGLEKLRCTAADLICVGLPLQRARLFTALTETAERYSPAWFAQARRLAAHLAWEMALAGGMRAQNYRNGLLGRNIIPALDARGRVVELKEQWFGRDLYAPASLKKPTKKDHGPEALVVRHIEPRSLPRGVVSMELVNIWFQRFYPHLLVHLGILEAADQFNLRRLDQIAWPWTKTCAVNRPAFFLTCEAKTVTIGARDAAWRGQYTAGPFRKTMARAMHECLVLSGEPLPIFEVAQQEMPYVFGTHCRRHFHALWLATLLGEYEVASKRLNTSAAIVRNTYAAATGALAERIQKHADAYTPENPRHFRAVMLRIYADRDADAALWAAFWDRWTPQDPQRCLHWLDAEIARRDVADA